MANQQVSTNAGLDFNRQYATAKVLKADINHIIMDYLLTEGYPSAARKFAMEANIQPRTDPESISKRVHIRNAILTGDIQEAIDGLNDLNREILDSDAGLHFALLQLQLIEIIKKCSVPSGECDIRPALEFASKQLAPRAPTSRKFLSDLERTMALLIFPSDKLRPELAELLDPDLRQNVARKVNQAILTNQGERREAKIKGLVHLRAWAEQTARNSSAARDIPPSLPLGLDMEHDLNGRFDPMQLRDGEAMIS